MDIFAARGKPNIRPFLPELLSCLRIRKSGAEQVTDDLWTVIARTYTPSFMRACRGTCRLSSGRRERGNSLSSVSRRDVLNGYMHLTQFNVYR